LPIRPGEGSPSITGDPALESVCVGQQEERDISMVRALIFGSSAFAVLALASGPMPGYAQDMPTMCNPVVDSEGDPVVQAEAEGDVVLHEGTYPCPQPEPVAQIAPAAPPEPEPLPEGGNVYFDFDQATLRPDAETALNSMVSDIQGRELAGITVAGHADRAGPEEYNMQLSERRANTVAAELIQAGIPARVITTEAFGETDPAVETGDGVPEQANRRVVVDFEG
jgi:outer membrane protein OmpA-like peptidoglycan-associated protein